MANHRLQCDRSSRSKRRAATQRHLQFRECFESTGQCARQSLTNSQATRKTALQFGGDFDERIGLEEEVVGGGVFAILKTMKVGAKDTERLLMTVALAAQPAQQLSPVYTFR